jgi:hypothetical protein
MAWRQLLAGQLTSPDKPHRLPLEFQRVPRQNHSRHLKPSKADPTQSAMGDVFQEQDQIRLAKWMGSPNEAIN